MIVAAFSATHVPLAPESRYIVADLRVFLRKHGLSATGKKVELVQRVIDHLNSDPASSSDSETEVEEEEEEDESEEAPRTKATKKRGSRKQESDVDDEESDVGDEESDDEYEESDDESECEFECYKADPGLRKILQRLGDCCRQRNPGLTMKEIDRFERELQANVRGAHPLRDRAHFPSPHKRLTTVVRALCVDAAVVGQGRSHPPRAATAVPLLRRHELRPAVPRPPARRSVEGGAPRRIRSRSGGRLLGHDPPGVDPLCRGRRVRGLPHQLQPAVAHLWRGHGVDAQLRGGLPRSSLPLLLLETTSVTMVIDDDATAVCGFLEELGTVGFCGYKRKPVERNHWL